MASSNTPSTTAIIATATTAVAVGAAAATLAARRRAALAERASEPSSACPSSAAAAARRWNAQNPPSVFQLAVFYVDESGEPPKDPAALIFHPRRGALADLFAAVASSANGGSNNSANSNNSSSYRLFLSISGTGSGPFVELTETKKTTSSSANVDPDATALGALEEATQSAKRVAVVYASCSLGDQATTNASGILPALAQKIAPHPGLVAVPYAPNALPLLGHALLAAKGPHMHPVYNLAHHLFLSLPPAQRPELVRVRLPAMGPPKGVVVSKSEGDDPEAWTTVIQTRDPRVVAELLAREDVWPKKFDRPPQELLRDFAGPGLFTSSSDEPDWVTAHGVLPKLFNALRVTAMFPAVMTKTRAFVARWASLMPSGGAMDNNNSNSYAIIDHATDWLTSMTIDAVVLAAVGTDMKNVERLAEERPLHPFITAFRYGLGYAVNNVSVEQEFGKIAAWNPFFDGKAALKRRYLEAKGQCEEIVAALVEQTRYGELRGAGGQPNVIAAMMADRSTADGSLVPVTSFYGHMINIMVAGHETTAATLGFTLSYLSANPDCEKKVLEELDRVLGVDVPSSDGKTTTTRAIREPTASDIGKLPYLEACFREALRLHPAAVAVNRDAARDTILLGTYSIKRGQRVVVNLPAMHRHERFWEGDGLKPATEYDPERFMPPHVGKRHPNAFAGFGFGSRACIGSAFALLEAKTFLAVLLPRFSIKAVGKATSSDPAPPFPYPPPASLADGGVAPTAHGLRLRVSPRAGFVAAPPPPPEVSSVTAAATTALGGGENLRASGTPIPSPRPSATGGGAAAAPAAAGPNGTTTTTPSEPVPFHVLFGSNSGTCEALASRVAEVAAASGFSPVRLTALDAVHAAIKADGGAGSLPSRAAVAIVCSTYNGTPPDNARSFLQWVQKGAADGADGKSDNSNNRIPSGIGYCVVGLGNSQWAATYQKVPRQLDEAMGAYGATRVRAFRGIDVNEPDFQDSFEAWLGTLGAEMRVHFGLEEGGGGKGGGEGGAVAITAASGAAAATTATATVADPPTLASLSPAPRFKLEFVDNLLTTSSNISDVLKTKSLEPLCIDIADVSRALIAGRRRLASVGAPAKPVVGTDPYHPLRVIKNDELQQPNNNDNRSTRHVELELPSLNDLQNCATIPAPGDGGADPSAYEAGDHLEVLACNAPALVESALRALKLTGDEVVVWTPATGRSARGVGAVDTTSDGAASSDAASTTRPLSITTTARLAVAWVADLGAPPSRRVVEALIATCQCPPERKAAHDKYASDQGYKQNVLLARLTVPELLSSPEMRSAPPPPLDALLLALPRIAPRYYSISSSPLASEGQPKRTCSITVGLVKFNTGSGRVHEGAASSLVHRTKAGDSNTSILIGTVRRLQSTFRLPKDPTVPIIMIGPGTGVAPMMGFLQEREVLKTKGTALGAAHLFFGCRSDADFIYRERLEGYTKTGVLTGLHVAFSRKEGVPKTYVQDLIEQEGAEMWRLLSAGGGYVYVCGDARRMAPDVKAAFRDLAVRYGGRSQAAADAWMGSMLEGARYLEDVWAGN